MVVFRESFLNLFAVELLHVLQNLLRILVFPFRISVIFIKIIFFWWEKWRFHLLLQKIVPREVSHPDMIFDVLRAIQTKSVQGFSLNEPVNEVSSFYGPPCWYILPFDQNLLRKDMVSDLSPVLSNVRSSPKHTFVPNNTHRKVVHRDTMRLLTHNFRSHISGSS